MFLLALNSDIYKSTSPPNLAEHVFGEAAARSGRPFGISLHIVLRKLYSIGAFALVGWTALQALPRRRRSLARMTLLVAIYSAAIELAQWRGGSTEGWAMNALDVLCGALGGALAVIAERVVCRGLAARTAA